MRAALPGGSALDTEALSVNAVLFVVEALAAVGQVDAGGDALGQVLLRMGRRANRMVFEQLNSGRPIDFDFVEYMVRGLVEELSEFGIDRLVGTVIGDMFKNVFNVTRNVSNFVVLAQRFTGISNFMLLLNELPLIDDAPAYTRAVEDTLVVVGQPWAPVIESFSPVESRKGRTITIRGSNFGFGWEKITVVFGFPTTNPENPQPGAFAEGTLGGTFSDRIVTVEVPELARTGPLSVIVEGKGFTSTARLPWPHAEFIRIPPPVITSISTNIIYPNQPFAVNGSNFTVRASSPPEVVFNNGLEFVAQTFGDQTVRATAPGTPGDYQVQIRTDGELSNPINVTVSAPPPDSDGSVLLVNSTAVGVSTGDNFLTVEEAFQLAAGSLSYVSLSTAEKTLVQKKNFRDDDGTVGGGFADTIQFDGNVFGINQPSNTFTVPTQPLSDFDVFQSEGLLANSNFFTGSSLVVTGFQAQVSGIALSGITGPGLILRGAQASGARAIRVVSSTGSGILVE